MRGISDHPYAGDKVWSYERSTPSRVLPFHRSSIAPCLCRERGNLFATALPNLINLMAIKACGGSASAAKRYIDVFSRKITPSSA
jgi:hypothetical protein